MKRTIRIPVAEVITGGTKQEFYADLRESLDLARRAANIVTSHCALNDTELMNGGKFARLPVEKSSYRVIAGMFPGATYAAASIAREVESKYRYERWRIGKGLQSLCNYRSHPWPLAHKTLYIEDRGEGLIARVKLLHGWWELRLAGGSNYRDQIASIRSALKIGDSKIWIRKRAILGLSVELPEKKLHQMRRRVLHVRSSRHALLISTVARGEIPFTINGDRLFELTAAHQRRYYRLRQDAKLLRVKSSTKEQLRAFRNKMRRRVDSFVHQASSAIVRHAERRKATHIELDLTVKSCCRQFPWHTLREYIRYKADAVAITVEDVTTEMREADLEKPHIYFAYNPSSARVKIGRTCNSKRMKAAHTWDPDWVHLAIANYPVKELTARENEFLMLFDQHRIVDRGKPGKELRTVDPVLAWLREVDWLGNAGNLSQIAQFLDVSTDRSRDGHLKADSEEPASDAIQDHSHKAANKLGYAESNQPAPAVTNEIKGN